MSTLSNAELASVFKEAWESADKKCASALRKLKKLDKLCDQVSDEPHIHAVAAAEWLTQRCVYETLSIRATELWSQYEHAAGIRQ